MNYKKKVLLLFVIAVLLAFVFAGTFIFGSRGEDRRSYYSWIKHELLEQADRIEIEGMSGFVFLERKNDVWVMPFLTEKGDNPFVMDFPVKQSKVEDLFRTLSRRDRYPVRSRSAAGVERFGLGEGFASRIIIRGGAGLPLLDLYIGFGDAVGSNIYLRKGGSTEARSGEDKFSIFTETGRTAWYDLSLFGDLSPEMIQRVLVYLPNNRGSYSVSRSGRDWVFSPIDPSGAGSAFTIDRFRAESWIRLAAGAEADDFDYFSDDVKISLNTGRLILDIGDGSSRTLFLGEGKNNFRSAAVSGTSLLYSLSENTIAGLFPDESYFVSSNVR